VEGGTRREGGRVRRRRETRGEGDRGRAGEGNRLLKGSRVGGKRGEGGGRGGRKEGEWGDREDKREDGTGE